MRWNDLREAATKIPPTRDELVEKAGQLVFQHYHSDTSDLPIRENPDGTKDLSEWRKSTHFAFRPYASDITPSESACQSASRALHRAGFQSDIPLEHASPDAPQKRDAKSLQRSRDALLKKVENREDPLIIGVNRGIELKRLAHDNPTLTELIQDVAALSDYSHLMSVTPEAMPLDSHREKAQVKEVLSNKVTELADALGLKRTPQPGR